MPPASGADDERVLSYHDVLLRRSDVDLLLGPHWLNDQLIAFWFTYLLENLFTGLAGVCLMPPGTSFLLLNSDPSDAAMIFEALKLHEQALVVFAVNDNPDVEHAAGGSHWSCLAFHRATNTFRHYDSSPAAGNRSVARQLAGAAAPLVRSKGAAPASTVQQPQFVQVLAMPAQQNGHDCGLYVCAAAEALCSLASKQQQQQSAAAVTSSLGSTGNQGGTLAAGFEQQEQEALQVVTSSSVAQLRQRMHSLILDLSLSHGA